MENSILKIAELPDIHFAPECSDIIKTFNKQIIKNCQDIDIIVILGDLFKRLLYASNQSKYNELIDIVKSWVEICPVVAIEGTPSHDGKGCYAPLEELGLVLLKPNNVYGLYSYSNTDYRKKVNEISNIPERHSLSAILFGIPELNKSNILSKLDVSSDEASLVAEEAFKDYVTDFLAPHRLMYKDIPAIALFHGNVTDLSRDNETDNILKRSDIIISTDILEIANISRWSLGHIHNPWESEKISAGYAGSWGSTWNETGFLPAFNKIEFFNDGKQEIIRIPYGTPERKKIKSVSEITNKDIAYWLESDTEELPGDVHPWSRRTLENKIQSTRRISEEESKMIKTLEDIFKAFDPDVTKRVLKKVSTLESLNKTGVIEKKEIILKSVRVKGSVFFQKSYQKEEVFFDIDELNYGLTALSADNGGCKSALMGFCSLHPIVIGKESITGRTNVIKDFFYHPESEIEKFATVNGVEHRHLIQIKAAHTKSPKVECYLYIDGVNQLGTTSFDEMSKKCEELYGSLQEHIQTVFYVQPQQGKTESSLMTASMSSIRDLVQKIAGIDRSHERQQSKNNLDSLELEVFNLEKWIDAAEEFSVDTDKLKLEISELEINKNSEIKIKENLDKKLDDINHSIGNLQIIEDCNKTEIFKQSQNNKRREDLERHVYNKTQDLKSYIKSSESLGVNKKAIEDNQRNSKILSEITIERVGIIEENRILKMNYDRLVVEYNNNFREIEFTINRIESNIEAAKEKVELITACPECGFLDEGLTFRRETLLKTIIEDDKNLVSHKKHFESLIKPLPPIYKPVPDLPTIFLLDFSEINIINADILKGENAVERTNAIDADILEISKEINGIRNETYEIDFTVEKELNCKNFEKTNLNVLMTGSASTISSIETRIKLKEEALYTAKVNSDKISLRKKNLKIKLGHFEDWKYINLNLRSDKIPAFELDLVLDKIDKTATKFIESFREGRYTFETVTQKSSSKSVVDKFDIMIHDALTGKKSGFLQHSPGEKAFFNEAYVESLTRERLSRTGISFSPKVRDETDGPVKPERIPEFWKMFDSYSNDSKTLVISHNPESSNFIQNEVFVKDLLK